MQRPPGGVQRSETTAAAGVLRTLPVQAEQFAREGQWARRARLTVLVRADRQDLADQDRVAAVPGGRERAIARAIEVAVDLRRHQMSMHPLRGDEQRMVRLV